MSEALIIIHEARGKEKESEDADIVEKKLYSQKVRLERQHSLLKSMRANTKAEKRWTGRVEKIHKHHSGVMTKLAAKWVAAKKKYNAKVRIILKPLNNPIPLPPNTNQCHTAVLFSLSFNSRLRVIYLEINARFGIAA